MGEERESLLSRMEVSRALHLFLYTGFFWAIYGQVAGIMTPVFTGFALSLGIKESDIGTIASFSYLAGLAQLFSLPLARNIRSKPLFIIRVGIAHVILFLSVIIIPRIFPRDMWFFFLVLLVSSGAILGNLTTPLFQSWFATVIPPGIRARYISKRNIVVYLTSIAAAYMMGRFVDAVGGYKGFVGVFLLGMLTGIAGYLVLFKIPFGGKREEKQFKLSQSLLRPFQNPDFRRLLTFYLTWAFGVAIASPFYTVFMLRRLQLSYSTIAIVNNVSMVFFIIGLRFWSGFIDRYGNKPILQILMVPRVLIPLLWIFNSPNNYTLLPIVKAMSGFVFAGLTVAINNFLYGIVPKGEEKISFFAIWSTSANLAYFAGPIIGGRLVEYLKPVQFQVGIFPVGNLQLVFLLSAALMIVPVFLLRTVREEKASSPGYVLGLLARGNPFLFAYNFFLFTRAKEDKTRARAASAMGRSKSPLAVDKLIQALTDLSPEVRSEAARALGETKQREAIPSLVAELSDKESDIRPEAAEALGKIKSKRGIKVLAKALDDEDIRVRNSAAIALAEIGGEEAKKTLFQHFSGEFNRFTFPTLAEALSRLNDRRIISRAIEELGRYTSPVIKLQILNSICRVLGGGNSFYQLHTAEELERAHRINQLLTESQRAISGYKRLPRNFKERVLSTFTRVIQCFEGERYDDFLKAFGELSHILNSNLSLFQLPPERYSLALDHLQAIEKFLLLKKSEDIEEEKVAFLTVCLKSMVKTLTGKR